FFNGNVDLFADAGDHHIGFIGQITSRIDEIETAPVPGGFSIVSITGDTVLVVHNSLSAADKTVKNGGLADVGPSYNRNYRKHVDFILYIFDIYVNTAENNKLTA